MVLKVAASAHRGFLSKRTIDQLFLSISYRYFSSFSRQRLDPPSFDPTLTFVTVIVTTMADTKAVKALRIWVFITGLAGLSAASGAYINPTSPHDTLYRNSLAAGNVSLSQKNLPFLHYPTQAPKRRSATQTNNLSLLKTSFLYNSIMKKQLIRSLVACMQPGYFSPPSSV